MGTQRWVFKDSTNGLSSNLQVVKILQRKKRDCKTHFRMVENELWRNSVLNLSRWYAISLSFGTDLSRLNRFASTRSKIQLSHNFTSPEYYSLQQLLERSHYDSKQ